MTQLVYNEAFDPYHAAFRFLRLWKGCKLDEKVHFDLLRIMDFYLLFPFRIQNISLYSEDRGWRQISKRYQDRKPYGELPDDITIFSRMQIFQRSAAASLVKANFLSLEAWQDNQVQFNDFRLPAELDERCVSLNDSMADIIHILCGIKDRYPLLGARGLKDRSGLMEYRYDSI